jgi:pyruvate,water dikinase
MSNTYLLYPTTTTDLALLGGKARALAALANAALPIPAWFALSPDAFTASLSPEQQAQLTEAPNSGAALAVLAEVSIQPELEKALVAAVTQLCPSGTSLAAFVCRAIRKLFECCTGGCPRQSLGRVAVSLW